MNYIGVDCHISTLDFAVVTKMGRVKNKARVKTSAKEFMEFVKKKPCLNPEKSLLKKAHWRTGY